MKTTHILIERERGFAMAKADYATTREFEILYKSALVLQGTYKKARPDGMHNGVSGVFTSSDGRLFLVYSDWSANCMERVTSKGYPISID